MTHVLQTRRSYLETDLDTLSTNEFASKPEIGDDNQGTLLPPGLSGAHLLKLKFMGVDPRSPSTEIVRTPIQVYMNSLKPHSICPYYILSDNCGSIAAW